MERDDIINKIRALRNKANNGSSTQAEAMEAASLAAKLMTKYDVAEASLRDAKDIKAIDRFVGTLKSKPHPVMSVIWAGIQDYTETKAYRMGGETHFVGMPQDVEMALYLSEMLISTATRGWFRYSAPMMGSGQKYLNEQRAGFNMGFAVAINARLQELLKERHAARKEVTGSDLVIHKGAVVQEYLDEFVGPLSSGKGTKTRVQGHQDGFNSGRAVADTVVLNRPVEGKATEKLT